MVQSQTSSGVWPSFFSVDFDKFGPGSQDERPKLVNIGIPSWVLWSLPLNSHWVAYQILRRLDDATTLASSQP